eukprot:5250159-Pyramimonas_sp.AAC.1
MASHTASSSNRAMPSSAASAFSRTACPIARRSGSIDPSTLLHYTAATLYSCYTDSDAPLYFFLCGSLFIHNRRFLCEGYCVPVTEGPT